MTWLDVLRGRVRRAAAALRALDEVLAAAPAGGFAARELLRALGALDQIDGRLAGLAEALADAFDPLAEG
jgi:hypothetical protein